MLKVLKQHPRQQEQQEQSKQQSPQQMPTAEPPALESSRRNRNDEVSSASSSTVAVAAGNQRKFHSMESYFDTPPSSPAPLVEAWPSNHHHHHPYSLSGSMETATILGGGHTPTAREGGVEGGGGGAGNSSSSSNLLLPGAAQAIMPTSNSLSMRLLALAIHKALFGLFLGTFLYSIYADVSRGRYNILTNWIYLTHWNLTFQVVFTGLELLSDYSASVAERTAPFRAKFFHSIVAPYSFFVAASFWGMVAVDESLVRPEQLEDRCEEWYNQVVHTLIVPAALLEGLANYHRPSPLPEAFSITVVCGVIYAFWSIMWGILFDLWSYELFRALTLGGFLLLVVGSTAALVTLNLLGRTVHEVVWRSQRLLDARHQQYVLQRMQAAQAQAQAQAQAAQAAQAQSQGR